MGEMIRDFRDLRVYQSAFEAQRQIFKLTKTFPTEERFALTGQIRDCSRSVCADIAEAWRKRRYPASFVSKLSDADGEAAETTVWLDFALDNGYLKSDVHKDLFTRYDRICAQLVTMMNSPERWCSNFTPKK